MKVEALTWLGIGLATAAYIGARHRAAAAAKPVTDVVIANTSELDPTRWRHTGEQPVLFLDGNRARNDATFETEREIANVLGF